LIGFARKKEKPAKKKQVEQNDLAGKGLAIWEFRKAVSRNILHSCIVIQLALPAHYSFINCFLRISTMPIELPPLPYGYDALEPFISRRTLEFHHDKHHKKYVDTANQMSK
jgi:hypothetical protein